MLELDAETATPSSINVDEGVASLLSTINIYSGMQ
jgi:hypothetical protein